MPEELKAENTGMGVYDLMLIMNIVSALAMQVYKEFKKDNPAPMTRDEWLEIQPALVAARKAAVESALDI